MKILYVSKTPTHPTDAGNRKVTLSTCEVLSTLGNEVHFLYIDERGVRSDRDEEFEECYEKTREYWNDRFHVLKISKLKKLFFVLIKIYRNTFQNGHQGLYDTYPGNLHKEINRLDSEFHFDACIVNYIWLTKAFKYIKIPKKACYTHDAMAYRNLKVKEKCIWVDAAQEASALQLCTDIFALQDEEMAYFHILSPTNRIYNIYSIYSYHPQPAVGNKNILFLSGNNGYNQNGLKWFIDNVFPLIRKEFDEVKLLIAGGICKVLNDKYKDYDGIELKGFVDNPADFYALGDVVINPTYQGTGLKIKTFEAIANDKVTMVHPHSKSGIYRKDDAPLFASDKPEEWVAFLKRVWSDISEIDKIKNEDKAYMEAMNGFIISEYKRFINC